MTWHDVQALDNPTLVIPMGSTEQHGPHLPLDTDTRIAVALAERAAERMGNVVVGDAIAYGASGEHQDFAGTVSAGSNAAALYLVELVRSAVPPFGRVVVVNGHGGNAGALQWVSKKCDEEGRGFVAWTPTFHDADGHAGHTETSLMLALHPEAVRIDAMVPGNTTPMSELYPELRQRGVSAVSPSGVLGDPTQASAEHGNSLFQGLLSELRGLLLNP